MNSSPIKKPFVTSNGIVVFKKWNGKHHRDGWKPAMIFPDGQVEFWIDECCYYAINADGHHYCFVCDITTKSRRLVHADGQ